MKGGDRERLGVVLLLHDLDIVVHPPPQDENFLLAEQIQTQKSYSEWTDCDHHLYLIESSSTE